MQRGVASGFGGCRGVALLISEVVLVLPTPKSYPERWKIHYVKLSKNHSIHFHRQGTAAALGGRAPLRLRPAGARAADGQRRATEDEAAGVELRQEVGQGYLHSPQGRGARRGFNSTGRAYPDVALAGHAYQMVLDGRIALVDGTSASTPVFAGMVANVVAERKVRGGCPTTS